MPSLDHHRRIALRRRATAVLAAVAVTVSVLVTSAGPGVAAGGFGDVPTSHTHARSIQWMVDRGITTGTSTGCFSPELPVTRGQLATFLHRSAGRPAPAGSGLPFVDVPSGAYFTEAVAWMVGAGITTGTSPTTFTPERPVSRAELATFLWRHAGRPSPGSTAGFDDVPDGTYFTEAVAWMVGAGITTGTSPTTFTPRRALSRAELATFLWRHAGQPASTPTTGTCLATGQSTEGGGGSSTTPPPPPPSTPPGTPGPVGHFSTLPPGSALPSGEWCAARVRPAAETRPGNTPFNTTRGTGPNDRYPRADGNFVGTTDEIAQWVACKWGIDENVVRAQMAKESWWDMTAGGDLSWDQNACHPDKRTAPGTQCPESIGILQVRYLYHSEAFEDTNAIRSTAYNADYTYAVWRDCYEGTMTWLNTVERGATYTGGDLDGCLGVWFAGRYRTQPALTYIDAVNDYLDQRIWEQGFFLNY